MRWFHAIFSLGVLPLIVGASESSCQPSQTSNDRQRDSQEIILGEINAQVGMPAIHNAREKKILKEIYELRDQASFVTYTYAFAEQTGKFVPLCRSIGYPIPAATQFTAPESHQTYNVKDQSGHWSYGSERLPQADPNGLYSPASADGTWVMCKDPTDDKIKAVYAEPKVFGFPWRLTDEAFPGEKKQ